MSPDDIDRLDEIRERCKAVNSALPIASTLRRQFCGYDIPFLLRELAAWRRAVEVQMQIHDAPGTPAYISLLAVIARQRQLAGEGEKHDEQR